MSFLTYEDILYTSFMYHAVLVSLIDRFFIVDKHKAKFGACVGLLSLISLCGSEVTYPLLNISVNCLIIWFSGKRAGILSFSFSCCYLLYFRSFCSVSPTTNLLMMSTTMKMISASMEYSAQKSHQNQGTSSCVPYCFSFEYVISYAFHYVGIIGVPFYTLKTYCDYIILPFKHQSLEWRYRAIQGFIDSVLFILGRIMLNNVFTLSCQFDKDFDDSSIFYKMIFVYPLGVDFVLRLGCAFTTGDICCYITGLGAYPEFTEAKCGHGPTKNFEKMYALKKDGINSYDLTYTTVNNVDLIRMHLSPHFKDTLKFWNQTIQFWMYKYIYKTCPYNFLKKPATLLFSSFWHGLHLGNFTSLFFSSFVLYVEEMWEFKLRGRKLSILDKLLRIFLKLHILYNLALSFICQEWYLIVKYQTSVYWNSAFIIFLLFMCLFLVKKTSVS